MDKTNNEENTPCEQESIVSENSVPAPNGDKSIQPRAIQKLVVPREDICDGIAMSEELEADVQSIKIRKPQRREWIRLLRASELPTRLLLHKRKSDGMDVEHYYVSPSLRAAIRDELKDVRVFLYYSLKEKTFALWVVGVTLDNSWYESLQTLFTRPEAYFAENDIRVIPDKEKSLYRIRYRKKVDEVTWPQTPMDQLLGEAIGEERFILDASHLLYRELVEGAEL